MFDTTPGLSLNCQNMSLEKAQISFLMKDKYFCALFSTQIGPEKGVVLLAMAAILNAVWDLGVKQEGKGMISEAHLWLHTSR